MRRAILNTLTDWKRQKNRKVLLLRGARQVGKTYIVRELAKDFRYFVEINFEKNFDIQQFFEQNLDPELICTNLSAYYGIPIVDGETLLFLMKFKVVRGQSSLLGFFTNRSRGCM